MVLGKGCTISRQREKRMVATYRDDGPLINSDLNHPGSPTMDGASIRSSVRVECDDTFEPLHPNAGDGAYITAVRTQDDFGERALPQRT